MMERGLLVDPGKDFQKRDGLQENKSRFQISDHQREPQDQFFKNPLERFSSNP